MKNVIHTSGNPEAAILKKYLDARANGASAEELKALQSADEADRINRAAARSRATSAGGLGNPGAGIFSEKECGE